MRLEFAVPFNASLFGLSKQWLWQRVLSLLASAECRAHQRVSSEIQLALSKGGRSVETRGWQPHFDAAHRTFRTFFDKLPQGNIPKLEYDNAMIAFESSPEGCRTIREELNRKGFTLHIILN